jgi:hypothetical protein
MTSLGREIFIMKLKNVVNIDEAKKATLENKHCLHNVKLEWRKTTIRKMKMMRMWLEAYNHIPTSKICS